MADERKVICPRGHVMEPIIVNSIGPLRCLGHAYRCECGWTSPPEMSEESAYLAATRTPPNRPLTLKDMTEYDESDAVWVVSRDGHVAVVNGLDALEYAGYEYDALFFARKPSPADIEAARKERDT